MADTIYTRALARAVEAQSSTQALATLLHVPESTLLRWMSGRAQMPLQAFVKVIELLGQYEKAGGDASLQQASGEPQTFRMGELLARCARCDGTQFVPVDASAPIRVTSALLCRACGERVVHGDLIAQLAKDAVFQSRATTAARTKRQEQMLKRSPKLRAMHEAVKPKDPVGDSEA